MSRVYIGALDYDQATDTSQAVILLGAPSDKRIALHELELYWEQHKTDAPALMNWQRYSTSGSGGTTITIEKLDPDSAASGATLVQGVTTTGTHAGNDLPPYFMNTIGAFVFRPKPEDRIIIESAEFLGMDVGTHLNDTFIGGSIIWEEL